MNSKAVLETKSAAVAETVRRALMAEFPRLWVCVHHSNGQENRTIDVADNWGGPLPQEQHEKVQQFVTDMTGQTAPTEREEPS
jgi:hypothetical protein